MEFSRSGSITRTCLGAAFHTEAVAGSAAGAAAGQHACGHVQPAFEC